MKSLVNSINNAFEQETDLSLELVAEYHKRNERKKSDEAWLKKNKPAFERAMAALGKQKYDIGEYRISIVVPDASKFDTAKVTEFLEQKGILEHYTKQVLDEELLAERISSGHIDLEELKKYAWVEAKGTPRLTVKLREV